MLQSLTRNHFLSAMRYGSAEKIAEIIASVDGDNRLVLLSSLFADAREQLSERRVAQLLEAIQRHEKLGPAMAYYLGDERAVGQDFNETDFWVPPAIYELAMGETLGGIAKRVVKKIAFAVLALAISAAIFWLLRGL